MAGACLATGAGRVAMSGNMPIAEAGPPRPVRQASDIDPAKMFKDHIRLNKSGGGGAMLVRAKLSCLADRVA